MSRSKYITPTKGAKKNVIPNEEAEDEFAKRTLQLMCSYYEPLQISEILSFPQLEEEPQLAQEKKILFNSSVVDLRINRIYNNRVSAYNDVNNRFLNNYKQTVDKYRGSDVVLDDIFGAEQVERPLKPLYIRNEERDELDVVTKNRVKKEKMNFSSIEVEMKKRLEESQRIGKERAAYRVKRMSNFDENSKTQKRTPLPWKGVMKQEYKQLTKYDFDYKSLVQEQNRSIQKEASYYNQEDE